MQFFKEILILIMCFIACITFGQDISLDSLPHYMFKSKQLNDSIYFSELSYSNFPDKWKRIRNTELGLIICERDNKPYNIEIKGNKTIFEDDKFFLYNFNITGLPENTKYIYQYECMDTVSWGAFKVLLKFEILDTTTFITKFSRYINRNTPINDYELILEKLLVPSFKSHHLYTTREPKPVTPSSRIPFIEIKYNDLIIYKLTD